LDELAANLREHSQCDSVAIGGQYWPAIGTLELALEDNGRGLHGSLKDAGRDVADAADALAKVVREGYSAKDELFEMKRGTGLKNAHRVVVNDAVRGEFSLLSGNALYCDSAEYGDQFLSLDNLNWQGTIVSLRIQRPRTTYDLYEFIT
jgi:hypothetical protein